MDKQNVTLKTHELEVIGQGGMVSEPCQVGDWWVVPADQYTGTIPDDIQKKWSDFKAHAKVFNMPVIGYLILDDMRDVMLRRAKEAEEERERQAEALRAWEAEAERQRIAKEQELRALEQVRRAEAERERKALERQQALERQRREAAAKAAEEAMEVTGQVLKGIAIAVGAVALGAVAIPAAILFGLLRFDPVLVAVLPPDDEYPGGRWIAVASWWD